MSGAPSGRRTASLSLGVGGVMQTTGAIQPTDQPGRRGSDEHDTRHPDHCLRERSRRRHHRRCAPVGALERRGRSGSTPGPSTRAPRVEMCRSRDLARLQHRQTPQCCRKSAPSVAGSGLRISGRAFGLPHADRTDRGLAPRAALSSCPIFTHNGLGHPQPGADTDEPERPAASPSTPTGQRPSPHGPTASRRPPPTPSHPRRAGAYVSAWAALRPVGRRRGAPAFPAAPATVAAYLAARSGSGALLSRPCAPTVRRSQPFTGSSGRQTRPGASWSGAS